MDKIINLLPCKVLVFNDEFSVIHEFKSEGEAKIIPAPPQKNIIVGWYDEVPIYKPYYGEVVGLPAYKKGTNYIVSYLVKTALPERKDLLLLSDTILFEDKSVVGCKAFSR